MILEITMIRNGATKSELQGGFSGFSDEPLCENGISGIKNRIAANAYPKVPRVYTGPLRGCRDTAALIYGFPTLVMSGLNPFDYGELSGYTYRDMTGDRRFLYWAGAESIGSMANGEPPHASQKRIILNFREIVGEMEEYGIQTASVIAHKAVILLVLNRFCVPCHQYAGWEIEYGGGCTIHYNTRQSALKVKNTF